MIWHEQNKLSKHKFISDLNTHTSWEETHYVYIYVCVYIYIYIYIYVSQRQKLY